MLDVEGEKHCNKYTNCDVIIFFIVVFILFVIGMAFASSNYRLLNDIHHDIRKINKIQIKGATNFERSQQGLKENSVDIKRYFLKISADNVFQTMVKQLDKTTKMFIATKQRELKEKLKKELYSDEISNKNEDTQSNKNADIPVVFDLSPSTSIPTEFGFVSAFDDTLTQVFIGAAPLIDYQDVLIKIKDWKIYYPLPEKSKIYRVGRTSSCLLKKKNSPIKENVIYSKGLCENKNTFNTENSFLFIPNRGQTPTIQLEDLCERSYQTKDVLRNKKNFIYYPSPEFIREWEKEEITLRMNSQDNYSQLSNKKKETSNVYYLTSLSYYLENKSEYSEIEIDHISCTSKSAPLSSDVFVFINKKDKLSDTVKILMSETLENAGKNLPLYGFIEYFHNWENNEKKFYPSINE